MYNGEGEMRSEKEGGHNGQMSGKRDQKPEFRIKNCTVGTLESEKI